MCWEREREDEGEEEEESLLVSLEKANKTYGDGDSDTTENNFLSRHSLFIGAHT